MLAAGILQEGDRHSGPYGKYQILQRGDGSLYELGRGAMGVAYKALDQNLHSHVALKVIQTPLLDDAEVRNRFFQEARIAGRIRHPNVAAVFHLEDNASNAYYAMEFIDGFTLEEIIRRKGRLDVRQSLEIVSQIARALGAADSLGLAHRDIRPGNIMLVAQDDGEFFVKVIGFGLAKLRSVAASRTHSPGVGKLEFASPEQLSGGEVDIRSDIYAVGLTLWFMLTGNPLTESMAQAISSGSQTSTVPASGQSQTLPKPVIQLLREMLHTDPAQRLQNPGLLQRAIYQCQQTLWPVKRKLWRRRGVLVGGIAGLLLLVAILLASFLNKPEELEPSLVVLQFGNVSGDPKDAWFSNSLTDEITTRLAQIPHLKVVSRGSALTFVNTHKRPPEIARELGVTAVLEGSAVRVGDEFRISTRLIDASADRVLAAETYNQRMNAIFDVQADLAVKIAAALKTSVGQKQLVRLKQKPTQSIVAYDYYLRGLDFYTRYEKTANEQAIALFKKALESDANYALAFTGLADAYAAISARYGGDPKWLDEALKLARKAQKLDPDLAEAYKAAGTVYAIRGAYRKSLEANRRAIVLNPNLAAALVNIGIAHREMGHLDDAVPWFEKAMGLEPLNTTLRSNFADLYVALNEPIKATETYKRTLDLEPEKSAARIGLCRLHLFQGKVDTAKAEAEEILKAVPSDLEALSFAAQVSLFSGAFTEARRLYARLLMSNRTGDVLYYGGIRYLTALAFLEKENGGSARTVDSLLTEATALNEDSIREGPEYAAPIYDMAAVNAIWGRSDKALDLLTRAVDAGWTDYPSLRIDPRFRSLKNDVRFLKIVSDLEQKVEEMRRKSLDNTAYAEHRSGPDG